MMHASLRWPMAHSVSLWPYALRTAVDVMNSTPHVDKTAISPIEHFSGVEVRPQLRNFHSFGCPVYVLNARLQDTKAQPKWESRARLGIYLGMSPRHARSVALVLKPRTRLVSPQFHVKLDDEFETVRTLSDVMHGYWKKLAGFVSVMNKSGPAHNNKNRTMVDNQVNKRCDIMATDETNPNQPVEPFLQPLEGDEFQGNSDEMNIAMSGPEF